MEFLKNHYEKLILSLVLLLMAGGAVVLVMEVGSVQTELEAFRGLVVASGGQQPPTPNPTNYLRVLANATPPLVDLAQTHKVFNSELWYADTSGNLVSSKNVGPHKLVATRIEPLHLKIELGVTVAPERTNYVFRGLREYETSQFLQRIANTTITLNGTNLLDRNRKISAVVREIRNPGENPEIHFDLSIGGAEYKPMPPISKAAPFLKVIEFAAALEYKPENQKWPPDRVPPLPQPLPPQSLLRKDARLYFAGDTNIVVDITASNVVVRAVSNDKHTTVPFVPAQALPARLKAP